MDSFWLGRPVEVRLFELRFRGERTFAKCANRDGIKDEDEDEDDGGGLDDRGDDECGFFFNPDDGLSLPEVDWSIERLVDEDEDGSEDRAVSRCLVDFADEVEVDVVNVAV